MILFYNVAKHSVDLDFFSRADVCMPDDSSGFTFTEDPCCQSAVVKQRFATCLLEQAAEDKLTI